MPLGLSFGFWSVVLVTSSFTTVELQLWHCCTYSSVRWYVSGFIKFLLLLLLSTAEPSSPVLVSPQAASPAGLIAALGTGVPAGNVAAAAAATVSGVSGGCGCTVLLVAGVTAAPETVPLGVPHAAGSLATTALLPLGEVLDLPPLLWELWLTSRHWTSPDIDAE